MPKDKRKKAKKKRSNDKPKNSAPVEKLKLATGNNQVENFTCLTKHPPNVVQEKFGADMAHITSNVKEKPDSEPKPTKTPTKNKRQNQRDKMKNKNWTVKKK